MQKGRKYILPRAVVDEFNQHCLNIGHAMKDSKRIPSKRSYRAMKLLKKSEVLDQYYWCLAGRPGAVLISKGWSFNAESAKTINRLQEDGWFVIAALQAIHMCKQFDVKPHAYCMMDPQHILAQYLPHVEKDAIIFHDMMVDPVVWESDLRRVVFASFSAHVHDSVMRKAGMFVIDLPNHTVSEIMQAVVQFMGAKRVFFAGIDYCEQYHPEEYKCPICGNMAEINKDESRVGFHCKTCNKTAGYNWFTIDVDGKKMWSNNHYCLGLQAFIKHMIVDHYSVEKLAERWDTVMEQTKDCDKSKWTPNPVPMRWNNFDFFYKIGLKKKYKWNMVKTGLTVDKFEQSLIDDFNP